MVRRVVRTTESVRLQQSFEVISLPQNRKFQDFVETKFLADNAVTNAKLAEPSRLVFLYDFSVNGGAAEAITLKGADGNDLTLPGGAIVTNATIVVETAVTSGGSATVKFGTASDDDAFKAATGKATLVADYVVAGTNTIPFKVGAAPEAVTITPSVALTAGKLKIYVEYFEA